MVSFLEPTGHFQVSTEKTVEDPRVLLVAVDRSRGNQRVIDPWHSAWVRNGGEKICYQNRKLSRRSWRAVYTLDCTQVPPALAAGNPQAGIRPLTPLKWLLGPGVRPPPRAFPDSQFVNMDAWNLREGVLWCTLAGGNCQLRSAQEGTIGWWEEVGRVGEEGATKVSKPARTTCIGDNNCRLFPLSPAQRTSARRQRIRPDCATCHAELQLTQPDTLPRTCVASSLQSAAPSTFLRALAALQFSSRGPLHPAIPPSIPLRVLAHRPLGRLRRYEAAPPPTSLPKQLQKPKGSGRWEWGYHLDSNGPIRIRPLNDLFHDQTTFRRLRHHPRRVQNRARLATNPLLFGPQSLG
ncbi:hypothetical protein B0J13DRAFT_521077 [Dactylonectria estremocensis]|uniref:Uncharacterized protein n=1 Tax=Dactylonectria estremocensis TaxID=1079267 RepID=A0A9P9F618_9HYPO|nr:hypothetical protein B0J13DRAFT_521077 [Dactylonectria estremocensis]